MLNNEELAEAAIGLDGLSRPEGPETMLVIVFVISAVSRWPIAA